MDSQNRAAASEPMAVAPPLNYETLRAAFRAVENEPRRVHGTASDPHLTSVGGKTCIVCGRKVAP